VTDTNFQLAQPGTFADPLTEVLRKAHAHCWQAVEAEVAALLSHHADKLTADGRQRLVRHGHLPVLIPVLYLKGISPAISSRRIYRNKVSLAHRAHYR
jgi:hypothetical protein